MDMQQPLESLWRSKKCTTGDKDGYETQQAKKFSNLKVTWTTFTKEQTKAIRKIHILCKQNISLADDTSLHHIN